MLRRTIIGLAVLSCLTLAVAPVQAHPRGGWSIGFAFGPPVCYRPWYPCYDYYYYRPYPIYVAPPAVVYQPAPVVVQPRPLVVPAQTVSASEKQVSATSVSYPNSGVVQRQVQLLGDRNEKVRMEAVLKLGKMKAESAVDKMAARLAGDPSPLVREAAARALGLLGSPKGLTALKYAAQADDDRDVRRSAQFAVEVIHSNMRK